MDSFSPPSAETIRSWAEAEEAALERARARIRELQSEEAALIIRLKALRDMLGTFGPIVADVAPDERAAGPGPTDGQMPTKHPDHRSYKIADGHRGSVGFRIRAQVAEILAERQEPMHINDIWAEFGRRAWEIPGRGNAANITAHLTGAVEIVSPTRGYYVLATPGSASSDKTATATVRTSKARRTSARSSQGNR